MNGQHNSAHSTVQLPGEVLPKEKTSRNGKLVRFIKRIGVVGFLFFLGKGLLWLLVPYLVTLLF